MNYQTENNFEILTDKNKSKKELLDCTVKGLAGSKG